jgi:hypothetical protein
VRCRSHWDNLLWISRGKFGVKLSKFSMELAGKIWCGKVLYRTQWDNLVRAQRVTLCYAYPQWQLTRNKCLVINWTDIFTRAYKAVIKLGSTRLTDQPNRNSRSKTNKFPANRFIENVPELCIYLIKYIQATLSWLDHVSDGSKRISG